MQSRILQSILLAANSSLFAPLVQAHVGEHASSSPIESVHLLISTDHWLAVPLLLVAALALLHLMKPRSRS